MDKFYVFVDDSYESIEYCERYPSVYRWVWIVSKEYFEQYGCIQDKHITHLLSDEQLSLLGGELMESCFELKIMLEDFKNKAIDFGFIYLGDISKQRRAYLDITSI